MYSDIDVDVFWSLRVCVRERGKLGLKKDSIGEKNKMKCML